MDAKQLSIELAKSGIKAPARWGMEYLNYVAENTKYYKTNPNELTLPKIKKLLSGDEIKTPEQKPKAEKPPVNSIDEPKEVIEPITAASGEPSLNVVSEEKEGAKVNRWAAMKQAASGGSDTVAESEETTAEAPKEKKPRVSRGTKKNAPPLINGYIILMIADIFFPMAISWLHNFVMKKKGKAGDMKTSELQLTPSEYAKLEPLADAAAEHLCMEVNPVAALAITMGGIYAGKYISIK